MMNTFWLLLKTHVKGYATRAGQWVEAHEDKRPTRKIQPKAARPAVVPDDQLNLFSLLEQPSQVAPSSEPDTAAPLPSVAKPKKQAAKVSTKTSPDEQGALDYSLPWADVAAQVPEFGAKDGWKPSQRKQANEEAREVLAKAARRGSLAKGERKKLAAYSGEGGIGDSLNEYYTPPKVAAAMWYLLRRFGLERGHVLEPCAGSGVFQETKPAGLEMTAVEWSPTSAKMNALLHPKDRVEASALEHFASADASRYDAVIGNVPFGVRGAIAGFDKPNLGKAEDYFVDTCLDKTKEGGLVCLVVPHGIATNPTARAFRKRVMAKAEVVGLHRLPNTAFAHSGTAVVTDILLLRKRPHDVSQGLGTLTDDALKKVGIWDTPWLDGAVLDDPVRGHLHGTAQANWRGGYDVGGDMAGVPEAIATMPIPDLPDASLSMEELVRALDEDPEALSKAVRASRKNPYPELELGTTKLMNGQLYLLQGDPRRWHKASEIGEAHYAPTSKEGQALALSDRLRLVAEAVRDGLPVSDREQLRVDVQAYLATHGNPNADATLNAMSQRDPRFLPLLAAINHDGRLSDLLEGTALGTVAHTNVDWTNFDDVAQATIGRDGYTVTPEAIMAAWEDNRHTLEEVHQALYASDRYAVALDGEEWGLREDLTAGELYPKLDAHDAAIARLPTESPLRAQLTQQRQWLLEAIKPKTIEEVEVSLRSGFVPEAALSAYLSTRTWGDGKVQASFKDGVYDIHVEQTTARYAGLSDWYDKYLNRLTMQESDWDAIPKREQEFQEWLATSAYREETEDNYNRAFNSFKPKRYGNDPLNIPGWNSEMALNSYQYPALRWALEEGKGILAPDVGLGKTPLAIALVAKLREQGKARRPVIVVPKTLAANWAAEIEKFRPGSKVMIIGETHTRDKEGNLSAKPDVKSVRDKKWHQITQNDYDYILVTQPAFNDIDVDPIVKGQYVKENFWTQRSEALEKGTDRKRKEILQRYEQAMADKDFLKRTNAIYWNHLGVDCLIADEGHCFPKGTLVDGKPIESLRVGDTVHTYNHATRQVEKKTVTDFQVRVPRSMVTVKAGNGKHIHCTGNHPFWTQRGYVPADQLTILDFVYSIDKNTKETIHERYLSSVRHNLSAQSCSEVEEKNWTIGQVLLQQVLHGEMEGNLTVMEGSQSEGYSKKNGGISRRISSAHANQKSNEECGEQRKNAFNSSCQGMETHCAGRKWPWSNLCTAITRLCAWMGYGSYRIHEGAREKLSESLQNRYRQSNSENRRRSGWCQPQLTCSQGTRQKERTKITGTRVVHLEIHQQTSDGTFGGLCPDGLVYNIEVETHHNYFVDDVLVHNCYKNLFTARNRRGETPKFLGGSGFAKRALDMNHKTQWLRSQNNGKGVYFLTATPVKNSPLEVYSMLSHIVPGAFTSRGIRHEEDFIDRYCQIEQQQVLGTDGTIDESPVVVGFKNMDELRAIMGRHIYRKTAEEVGLKLPEKNIQEHFVDMTAEQHAVYADLREQAREAGGSDDSGNAHIFSIMDKMGKAAMDLSLLYPVEHANAESPKYDALVKNVMTHSKDGGQVVFADQVDVHQKIKDRLIASGMNAQHIGIINGEVATSSAARQGLADKFTAGKLKVIIGNTQTMGEGVNLQKVTTDIHHSDIPWEPASIQQRNGRGLRQGNTKESVRLHTYLAKRSFDGYRWQTMAGKRDWMTQLWSGGDRIENPAAQQGVTSRDEMLLLMSENPDAAKAEMEKNTALQLEKYTAMKKKGAADTFRQYVKAKMNHAALKDPESKTAQMLKMRLGRLHEDLSRNEHFEKNALLDHDGPILLNGHGHAFHPDAAFLMEGGGKGPATISAEPTTWNVSKVNVEKREVTMRPVGYSSNRASDTGETVFDLHDLESGVTPTDPVSAGAELRHLIENLTHPVALKRFPKEMLEEHLPAIQDRLRSYMAPKTNYEDEASRDRKELWGIHEGKTSLEKIFPGGTGAETATYVVPHTDSMHHFYDEVLKEKEWNKRYGTPSYGRGSRRKNSFRPDRFQQGLYAFHDYTERDAVLAAYKKEKEAKQAGMAKSRPAFTLFLKSFPDHAERPGEQGGSQPRDDGEAEQRRREQAKKRDRSEEVKKEFEGAQRQREDSRSYDEKKRDQAKQAMKDLMARQTLHRDDWESTYRRLLQEHGVTEQFLVEELRQFKQMLDQVTGKNRGESPLGKSCGLLEESDRAGNPKWLGFAQELTPVSSGFQLVIR